MKRTPHVVGVSLWSNLFLKFSFWTCCCFTPPSLWQWHTPVWTASHRSAINSTPDQWVYWRDVHVFNNTAADINHCTWTLRRQCEKMVLLSGMSLSTVWMWLDSHSLIIFTLVFLMIAEYLRNCRPSNFPPGPTVFPFVGNLFSLNFNNAHSELTKVRFRWCIHLSLDWMYISIVIKLLGAAPLTENRLFV